VILRFIYNFKLRIVDNIEIYIHNFKNAYRFVFDKYRFSILYDNLQVNFLQYNRNNFKSYNNINLIQDNNVLKFNYTSSSLFLILNFFFFVLLTILFLFYNKNKFNFFFKKNDLILKKIFNFSEQNSGSMEDFEKVIILLSVFYLSLLLNFFNVINSNSVLKSLLILFLLLVFTPILLIFNFGINAITYIKGSASYKSLFIELVYDLINLVAFFLRFSLQFVRFLLIFIMYALFHEFIFELKKNIFININESNVYVLILLNIIRFFFEILDSIFSFMTQTIAYILIIF
jgi:hypothetical protein